MLKNAKVLTLCALTIPHMVFGAEANSPDQLKAPEFTVLTLSGQETRVFIEIPEIAIEEVEQGGQIFHEVRTSAAGWMVEAGRPELPVMARFVAVPPGVSVDVTVERTDYSEENGIRVRPTQACDIDRKRGNALTIDQDFYSQDIFYPESVVDLGPPSTLRDCRVVPLIVYPVQYNPHREALRVFRKITVRLSYNGYSETQRKRIDGRGRSEAFEALYRSSIMNYSPGISGETERGGYLIITPDQYAEALSPLVQWKRQKGHPTDILRLSQIGAYPDHTHIRSAIENYYEQTAVPLEYVIVVGDVDEMPAYYYYDEMNFSFYDASDHFYTMLEGDDYFPDVFIGRLSVSSLNEMRTVVNKIVSYEREPYMGKTEWFRRALMVCNYVANASARTTKLWVRDKLLENGFSEVDTSFIYSGFECDVSFISSSINRGVSFVNYRGWIDWGNWTSAWLPPVNFGNIYRLQNGLMLPIVTDMVCNAADFSEFCPAEAWLRAGTVMIPKGAVAAIGPSGDNTKVYFNNVLDGGFYAGVFDDSLFTIGQALARAKMELYMQYPHNRGPGHSWNSVECYFYQYNLLGDPGLSLWTDIPELFSVEHPTTVARGASSMAISVKDALDHPLDGAYVCLTEGSEIISGGFTGSAGEIQLPLSVSSGCSVTVTVTKHNFRPYQGIIVCEEALQYVAFSGSMIDDDSSGDSQGDADGNVNPGETIELSLALQNTGSTWAAYAVSARITSDDPYVTVLRRDAHFGNISPGQSLWSQTDYLISVSPDCPDGHHCGLTLEATDRNNNTWNHLVRIRVEAPAFSVQELSIEDSDGIFPNNRFDSGETVGLIVTIANVGHKIGDNAQATLWTADRNITVNKSTAHFGSIDVGAEGANSADPFFVSAALGIDPGYQVQFRLFVQSSSGMIDTAIVSLSIGLPAQTDPVGPDAYGYLAYDDGDWPYQECPAYDWIEIDPFYGGGGTVLPLTDEQGSDTLFYEYIQGDTKVLQLPFAFQYYGEQYGEISVCSNGWLSLGSTWMTNFRNWGIPGVLNPPCLVAPFWDDLYLGEGGVVYDYDESTQRFIVEWSRVRNEYSDALETFQAILYNPERYTTETGDGEILFQYQSVENGDYAYNFATVGIESPDKADGLQYTYAGQYSPGAAELKDNMAIKFTTERYRASGPFLSYYGCSVDDGSAGQSSGDEDGLVDAGERIELSVRLINLGEEAAQGVEVTLCSTDPNATLQNPQQTYPDIGPGETAEGDHPFVVQIAPQCGNGHTIEFKLETKASGAFCSYIWFTVNVVAPVLLLNEYAFHQIQGDGDDRPESGESWQLQLSLRNAGAGQATGIWARVATNDESISLQQDISAFSDMGPLGTSSSQTDPFVFSVVDETPYHPTSFALSVFANDDFYQTSHPVEAVIERADVLLIDDDGGDDVEQWYIMALNGQDWSHERFDRRTEGGLDSVLASDHRTLIWFTGSERDSTLTLSDQTWLSAFLDNGGSLFLSGQNIASDLQESSFLNEYVHARCAADSSSDIWLYGPPGDPFTGDLGVLSLVSGNYGANNQASPDEIEVLEGAYPVLTYYNSGRPAALRYMNGYHLVFFAFGFESILEFIDVANAFEVRSEMLRRILRWFQFEPQIGDVNEDGVVNIVDIVNVINIILNLITEPTAYQIWAADYSGDGQINIIDAMGIVNSILDGRMLTSENSGRKSLH